MFDVLFRGSACWVMHPIIGRGVLWASLPPQGDWSRCFIRFEDSIDTPCRCGGWNHALAARRHELGDDYAYDVTGQKQVWKSKNDWLHYRDQLLRFISAHDQKSWVKVRVSACHFRNYMMAVVCRTLQVW
jgi:hypothetical protein